MTEKTECPYCHTIPTGTDVACGSQREAGGCVWNTTALREQAIRKAWQPTHKHIKSGGLYRVIGHGFIEATVEPATIYEATNGVVWIRPSKEFNDGRFEPV